MIIAFIKGQAIETLESVIVAESFNYLNAQFVFQTGDWNNLEKTAYFTQGETTHPIKLDENNIAFPLHLSAGEWAVSVVGREYADGELVERITTDSATIRVKPFKAGTETPFPEPSPTEIEALRAEMGNLPDLQTTDKTSLVSAINEVRRKGGSGGNVNFFDYINVKDYGAVGDGVTDDTAAIASAVEAVPENGTLYFPVGTYRVDNIMLKSNMNVKGDGKGSVAKLNDNAPLTNVDEYDDYWNNCFTIYQISNVTIEDIALDGNKENNASTGASKDYRLNGVIIQESTDVILHRIYAYNNGYHGCIMNVVERVEISDSEFTGNGFRPFHGHGTIVNCKFINNRCVNNGQGVSGDTTTGFDGIFFFDNCQRLLIDGNYVETNTNAGVDLGGSVLGDGGETSEYKGSSNIIVSNNIIKKSDTTTKTPAGIQLIPALLDKVTIESNTVIDCRFGVYGQTSNYSPLGSYINICNNVFRTTFGILFEMPVLFANISNNQFIDYTECGVKIAGATDTQITGNTFKPNGPWTPAENKDCIWLNNCKRTIVSNNKFFNRVAKHYSQHGIKENGTTDATLVTGNAFQDMAVAAYSLIGTNSKAVNNIVDGAFEA